MSKIYYVDRWIPWLGSQLGAIHDTLPGCHVRYQDGTAREPSDPVRDVPRAYIGRRHRGFVIRRFMGSPGLDMDAPQLFTDGYHPFCFNGVQTWGDPRIAKAVDKSFWDLTESVYGDSSSLGATIAEWRASWDSVVDRANTLLNSYRYLRRGNFRKFLRTLKLRPKRRHRRLVRTKSHQASSLWLEYWFGWAPLCSDIYSSLSVLQDPLASGWVSCKGRASERIYEVRNRSWYSYDYGYVGTSDLVLKISQGGQFRIKNYNAALNTKLGLNNPLAIAWEVVPFSFVVDWFTRLGSVIQAHTALYGFESRYTYSSAYVRGRASGVYGRVPGRTCEVGWNIHNLNRKLGLTYPFLSRPKVSNFGTSITRAASAVSLLVVLFTSKK